jgi:hypothetical protein
MKLHSKVIFKDLMQISFEDRIHQDKVILVAIDIWAGLSIL